MFGDGVHGKTSIDQSRKYSSVRTAAGLNCVCLARHDAAEAVENGCRRDSPDGQKLSYIKRVGFRSNNKIGVRELRDGSKILFKTTPGDARDDWLISEGVHAPA